MMNELNEEIKKWIPLIRKVISNHFTWNIYTPYQDLYSYGLIGLYEGILSSKKEKYKDIPLKVILYKNIKWKILYGIREMQNNSFYKKERVVENNLDTRKYKIYRNFNFFSELPEYKINNFIANENTPCYESGYKENIEISYQIRRQIFRLLSKKEKEIFKEIFLKKKKIKTIAKERNISITRVQKVLYTIKRKIFRCEELKKYLDISIYND